VGVDDTLLPSNYLRRADQKPITDTGAFPVSALELQTKMNSRQSVYIASGIPKADAVWEYLDGNKERCKEINQGAIDWALSHSGATTKLRYMVYGQKYVVGPDVEAACPTVACWIQRELEYVRSADGYSVVIRSPFLTTPFVGDDDDDDDDDNSNNDSKLTSNNSTGNTTRRSTISKVDTAGSGTSIGIESGDIGTSSGTIRSSLRRSWAADAVTVTVDMTPAAATATAAAAAATNSAPAPHIASTR